MSSELLLMKQLSSAEAEKFAPVAWQGCDVGRNVCRASRGNVQGHCQIRERGNKSN